MHRNCFFINCAVVSALVVLGWVGASCLRTLAPLAEFEEGVASAAVIGHAGDAAVRSLPKLRIGVRNRHLIEDETGKPFFVAGICPQNIVHWCTPDQMDTYFAERQARHFNFAWVIINGYNMSKPRPVLDDTNSAENPFDARGNSMLLKGTSWNPKNLNPAYVASVDAVVRSTADHGIYLFLDPFGAAYDWGQGDFDPAQHSLEEMRQWGEFWGNRYKNYPHVNFAFGADRIVWPQVDSVASGLKKYMPDRLMTLDWISGPPDWSTDATAPHQFYDSGHRWVNLNAWYQYHAPQWATWYHFNMANPVMPTCIFETFYEQCSSEIRRASSIAEDEGTGMGHGFEWRFRVRHPWFS